MVVERKLKKMTSSERREYRNSLEYCEDKCMDEGYDLKRCREELKRLGDNETLLAQDAWDMLMTATNGDVEAAEKEMIALLYLPPTFRTPSKCIICGPVLVKEAEAPCPWCDTDLPLILHGVNYDA